MIANEKAHRAAEEDGRENEENIHHIDVYRSFIAVKVKKIHWRRGVAHTIEHEIDATGRGHRDCTLMEETKELFSEGKARFAGAVEEPFSVEVIEEEPMLLDLLMDRHRQLTLRRGRGNADRAG